VHATSSCPKPCPLEKISNPRKVAVNKQALVVVQFYFLRGKLLLSRHCEMNNLATIAFTLLLLIPSALAEDVAGKTAQYMNAAARVNHFSGDVLISQNGKIVFEHAYGMSDREKGLPNTVNTKFRTASITKMFTAVAVLILRDRGKLRLEDSVCGESNARR
jgi:hypothetical protein